MEFEKSAVVTAPVDQVWKMLLDPEVMAACVPGMEKVEVISDTEYLVTIMVKVSFITARFKVRSVIKETRPPNYLRAEGGGEDATLTSSLKQSSEVFLTDRGDSSMELRMKLNIEVFGRFGAFGLNIIKTKADRMWDDFSRNLSARLQAAAA